MSQLSVHLPSRPNDASVRDAVARAFGVDATAVALAEGEAGSVGVAFFNAGAPFPVHLIAGRVGGGDALTDADLGLAVAKVTGMDALCSTHRFHDPKEHDGVVVHPDGSATFFWDDDETNLRLDGPAAPAAE